MSYGSNSYGALEYAGLLGGAALQAPPSAVAYRRYVVGADARMMVVHRQDDPVVVQENRMVRAMPGAIVEAVTFRKDPEALKPYSIEWAEVLDAGEAISSSGWTAPGLGLSDASITGTRCSVRIGGGTLGEIYLVENSISTSLGRQYTRGFLISVERT